jgi:hypothetical protein
LVCSRKLGMRLEQMGIGFLSTRSESDETSGENKPRRSMSPPFNKLGAQRLTLDALFPSLNGRQIARKP